MCISESHDGDNDSIDSSDASDNGDDAAVAMMALKTKLAPKATPSGGKGP